MKLEGSVKMVRDGKRGKCGRVRRGYSLIIVLVVVVIVVLLGAMWAKRAVMQAVEVEKLREYEGDRALARSFMDDGVEGVQAHFRDERAGLKPLHKAVLSGEARKVEIHLEGDVDVDVRTNLQATPLHLAVSHGFLEIAEMLIEHGADVNAEVIGGLRPVHLAVMGEDRTEEMVSVLLEAGASVDAKASGGTTALHLAAAGDSVEIVQLLIDEGAYVNVRGLTVDMTPLHQAALFGRAENARILLENGADVNARHSGGETPLATGLSVLESEHLMKDTTPERQREIAEVLRDYGGQE
jgi:hypothetical protein